MNPRTDSAPILIEDEIVRSQPPTDAPVLLEDDGVAPGVVDEEAPLGGDLPARAIRNGNGTITLPLRKPVTLTIRNSRGGERQEVYEALTFRDLTGADFRAILAASEAARQVVTLARSTGVREAVMNALFDRMSGADIVDAGTCAMSFLGDGAKAKTRA